MGALWDLLVVGVPAHGCSLSPHPCPTGSGRAGCGVPQDSPDVVLEVAEEDLQELMLGELRPLAAYMSGRLRVQGDLQLALRLEELFKAVKLHR